MSTPILIEDNGRTVRARIDGIIWHLGKEEFLKMINWKFSSWPSELKQINPADHSCARCINRPIDFCHTDKRIVDFLPEFLPGVTDKMIFDAIRKDGPTNSLNNLEQLKPLRPVCQCSGWSKMSPFYPGGKCKQGKWADPQEVHQ